MRITISINDITKRIYAISAVRAVNASDGQKTAVLTRDNALLLRRLICDSFMHTVGELAASVTDFSPPESDDSSSDIMWIDLDCESPAPGVAGESLAAAVLGTVLSLAFSGSFGSESDEYAVAAAGAIRNLRRATARCGRLRRHIC